MGRYFCAAPVLQGSSVLSNLHHPIFPRAMPLPFLPNNAFPLPALPTPKLIALGLDNKTAATVSKVYLSSALTLKETYETEYVNACEALFAASDNRGYSSKELRAKLLTVSVTRYCQALSKWMEEVIQRAKASVLKKSGKRTLQPKVSSCHCSRRHSFKLSRR